MAALHDGQHYLIETYSVVLTPGLQLLQPQAIDRTRQQGLLAGLSQARAGFAALPNVAVEIKQIEAELPSQVLLDQSFTDFINCRLPLFGGPDQMKENPPVRHHSAFT